MPDRPQQDTQFAISVSPASHGALGTAWQGLLALAAAMGIGRFAFTPLLPIMQHDGGLSLDQAGWLASANYLGYLAGALCAARLPLGAGALARLGLVVIVVGTAAMGGVRLLPVWLALRFACGMASAWVLVGVSSSLLARLAAVGRGSLGGIVFAGVGAGIALAGLFCLWLGATGRGADTGWLGLGAIALVMTVVVWPGLRGDPAPATTAAAAPVSTAGPHRWMVICYGLFGFGYILPATFLPVQARAIIADPAVFGLAWPVFGAAAAASTVLGSRLARGRGRLGIWWVCHLLMAAGVVLPTLWQHPAAIALAALGVGGTFMLITMLGMQHAREAGGAGARALIAAMTAAFAAGQIAGPLVAAWMHRLFGASLSAGLWLAALALVGSAIVLRRHARDDRAAAPVPTA